jgi:signal peptidase II
VYRSLIYKVALSVVAFDQITKWIAVRQLEGEPSVQVLGNFLKFGLVRNPGASFSMGTNMTIVFTIFAICVSAFIVYQSSTVTHRVWAIAAGGFLGGAVGNLVDRIFRSPGVFRGHVVDFITLPNYPLFNVADSAVVLSAIAIVILSIRGIEFNQETK